MAEEGHLPSQDIGRTEASTPMEHRAPLEVLPVERGTATSPYFPAYLISLLLVFFFFRKFCYNKFSVPF